MTEPLIIRVDAPASQNLDLRNDRFLGSISWVGTAFAIERGFFLSAWHVWQGPFKYTPPQSSQELLVAPLNSVVSVGGDAATDFNNYYGYTQQLSPDLAGVLQPVVTPDLASFRAAQIAPVQQLIGLATFLDPTVDQMKRFFPSVQDKGLPANPSLGGAISGTIDSYAPLGTAVGAGLIITLNPSAGVQLSGGRSGGPLLGDFGTRGDTFALGVATSLAFSGGAYSNINWLAFRGIWDSQIARGTTGTFQEIEQKGKNLIVGSDSLANPDDIKGTYRRDVIFAENGNDKVQATEGSDELNGGKGFDTLSYRDIYAYGTADRIAIKDIKLKNATNIEGITKGTFFLDKTYQGSSPIGTDQYRSFENLVTQTKEWRKAAGLDAARRGARWRSLLGRECRRARLGTSYFFLAHSWRVGCTLPSARRRKARGVPGEARQGVLGIPKIRGCAELLQAGRKRRSLLRGRLWRRQVA